MKMKRYFCALFLLLASCASNNDALCPGSYCPVKVEYDTQENLLSRTAALGTQASAYAEWFDNYCIVHVPFNVEAWLLAHEVKHCLDGQYH
jgi:hypothetical protein